VLQNKAVSAVFTNWLYLLAFVLSRARNQSGFCMEKSTRFHTKPESTSSFAMESGGILPCFQAWIFSYIIQVINHWLMRALSFVSRLMFVNLPLWEYPWAMRGLKQGNRPQHPLLWEHTFESYKRLRPNSSIIQLCFRY